MKLSEIQVSYQTSKNLPQIKTSEDAYQLLETQWDMNTIQLQEEFKILLLNRNNEVLGIYSLSKGGISGTVVDLKLLLAICLKCAASSMILVHNHPSGNLKPSNPDIELTKKIQAASELLDIKVLDHIILSSVGYYSFADEGAL